MWAKTYYVGFKSVIFIKCTSASVTALVVCLVILLPRTETQTSRTVTRNQKERPLQKLSPRQSCCVGLLGVYVADNVANKCIRLHSEAFPPH